MHDNECPQELAAFEVLERHVLEHISTSAPQQQVAFYECSKCKRRWRSFRSAAPVLCQRRLTHGNRATCFAECVRAITGATARLIAAVVRVERNQTRRLKKKYEIEREGMVNERGVKSLNERMHFHGARRSNPHDIALGRYGFTIEKMLCKCALRAWVVRR